MCEAGNIKAIYQMSNGVIRSRLESKVASDWDESFHFLEAGLSATPRKTIKNA